MPVPDMSNVLEQMETSDAVILNFGLHMDVSPVPRSSWRLFQWASRGAYLPAGITISSLGVTF
jgi:hypothetical protein